MQHQDNQSRSKRGVFRSRLARQRGSALVEFAVTFPILLLLCFGGGDLARVFVSAITVVHGAGTASLFGSVSNVNSIQFSTMRTLAIDDTADIKHLDTVSVSNDIYCDCPSAPASGPSHPNAVSCGSICTGYGMPRLFVRNRVGQTFKPVTALFPGIPGSVPLSKTAYMRVQ